MDIGIVYSNERNAKGKITPVAREIDFIAQSGGKKTYIQSAYALGSEEKSATENKPLGLTGTPSRRSSSGTTSGSGGTTTTASSTSGYWIFCWMIHWSEPAVQPCGPHTLFQ